MLKCFSLIGENDCSYESVGNIFAYLNAKTSLSDLHFSETKNNTAIFLEQ